MTKTHKKPTLKRILYLITHWGDDKHITNIKNALKIQRAWHDSFHEGTFENCQTDVCIKAKQLEMKAKE